MSASMKRKFGVALLLSMCVCWGTFAQGPKKRSLPQSGAGFDQGERCLFVQRGGKP